MKAVVLTGIRKMEMREVADPVIVTSDEVKIKIDCVGVCGSDVHYYVSGRIGDQRVEYPFAVGHECAGTIIEVGATAGLDVGERVAVDPAMPCYECEQCKLGRHHTCTNLRFLGCPGQAEGCLAEYIVMPARSCVKLPANVTFEQGMFSEPLSIGVYGVKLSQVYRSATVAVLGSGPIGLSVIAALRHQDVANIYVTDKIATRLAAGEESGAKAGFDANTPPDDKLMQINPQGYDVVYECCGQQEAVDTALRILKPGGTLLLIGIPTTDRLSFDMNYAQIIFDKYFNLCFNPCCNGLLI